MKLTKKQKEFLKDFWHEGSQKQSWLQIFATETLVVRNLVEKKFLEVDFKSDPDFSCAMLTTTGKEWCEDN